MQAEQVIQGLTGLGRGEEEEWIHWCRYGTEPDHPIRLWVTTRCTAEGETCGIFQLKSIRLGFALPCLLLFWRSRYMSGERHPNISFHFKSFVPSVRIREDFGLVIGRRLYKTRWRQLLLPCYPATLPSILLCRTVCRTKLRCSVPLRHSPSASHTPTLHPASL